MEETDYFELSEESYTPMSEESYEEGMEEISPNPLLDSPADGIPGDQEDLQERIDELLDQIGIGQEYGSMGDYYVSGAGCYAFPSEEVFIHFVAEEDRQFWTKASNGCYIPAASQDAYEAYLTSGMPEDEIGDSAEDPQSLPVSQEDITSLTETIAAMYAQDSTLYETSVLYMEQTEAALEDIRSQLGTLCLVQVTVCFFLALLCGGKFADVFFSRMRAG